MPRQCRRFVEGLSVHVIHRGHNRASIFYEDSDYEAFLIMLAAVSKRRGVAIHGFVLMTTHVHFLVTPTTSTSLPDTMKALGVRYVHYFNRKYERLGTLWSHRHRAILIEDEKRLLTCLRYIEQNPVEAGMVIKPDDYRWSSYRALGMGEPCEWLVPHPLYMALGHSNPERQAAYRALCHKPLTIAEDTELQLAAPIVLRSSVPG